MRLASLRSINCISLRQNQTRGATIAAAETAAKNKLQNQTVAENGRFTVLDIPAGAYDVKIIDDDDESCIVAEININKNEELRLTDEMMLQCAFKAKERSGL